MRHQNLIRKKLPLLCVFRNLFFKNVTHSESYSVQNEIICFHLMGFNWIDSLFKSYSLTSKIDKRFALLLVFFFASLTMFGQKTYTGANNGAWNTATNWSGGTVPATNDQIIIPTGRNVSLNTNFTSSASGSITINGTGSITIAAGNNTSFNLTVNGTIIFGSTNSNQIIVSTSSGNTNTSNTFTLGSSATFRTSNTNGIAGTNCSISTLTSGKATVTLPTTANYEFNGLGNQNNLGLPGTVNNLTLSGSGNKTLNSLTSVTGLMSITGTAKASISTGNITVGSLSLGGRGTANGTWGSISSAATYKTNTFFDTTSGTLTVSSNTATPVQLTGTRNYDGTTLASASNLTISNNTDGANLTLSGVGLLSLEDVGTRTISVPTSVLPIRRQFATGNTGASASNSFTVTMSSPPVNGNTLIAVISTRNTNPNTVSGISQTGTTWTRATQGVNAGGNTVEIWYAEAKTTSSAGITVTMNQVTVRTAAIVMEYSGVLALNPLDMVNNAFGTSTTASTGSVTTTQENELLIGAIGFTSSANTLGSLSGGFTAIANTATTNGTATNNTRIYALERIVTATETYTAGGTLSASLNWAGAIASFKAIVPSGTSLSLGGSAAGFYTLAGMTGSMTITPKSLTITPTISSKVYDGLTTTGSITTGTLGGLISPENINVSALGNYANANVGIGKTATVTYTLTDGVNGGVASNYSLADGSATGDITPKTLTITALNKSKCEGIEYSLPSDGYETVGLVGSETIGSVTLSSTGAASSAIAGPYPILISAATDGSFTAANYNINYVNGTLTVNAPIGITAITPASNAIETGQTTTITATGVVGTGVLVSWYSGPDQTGTTHGNGLTSNPVGPGTYYAYVTGACGTPIQLSTTIYKILTWTGAVSTAWNSPSNWLTNEVPSNQTAVIIPATTNQPVISGVNNFAGSITLQNNAILTINQQSGLQVTNEISVAESAQFIVSDKANLGQINPNAVNSGIVKVRRRTLPMQRLDYVLWSSPTQGTQTLKQFAPQTVDSRFYTYNSATNFYNVVSNVQTPFESGKGYLIRTPNNHSTTPSFWEVEFQGVPNNGTIVKQLPAPRSGNQNRYFLVGNPYTSGININSFIEANQANITGIHYIWRKTNGSTIPTYAVVLRNGNGVLSFNSNGQAQNPGACFPAGQGFIVEMKEGASQVVFTNDMRVCDGFGVLNRTMQETNNDVVNDQFILKFSQQNGEFTFATLGYYATASNEFESSLDALAIGDGTLSIASALEDKRLAFQSRATFETSDVVPLSLITPTAGAYQLSLDQVSGLFADGQNVYLRDNLTTTVHNLTDSAYDFTSDAGTFATRFELLYQSGTLGVNNPEFTENQVVIYKTPTNELSINTGNFAMDHVMVYDVSGRLLTEVKNINNTQTLLKVDFTTEVLLVKIKTQDGKTVSKKVLFPRTSLKKEVKVNANIQLAEDE